MYIWKEGHCFLAWIKSWHFGMVLDVATSKSPATSLWLHLFILMAANADDHDPQRYVRAQVITDPTAYFARWGQPSIKDTRIPPEEFMSHHNLCSWVNDIILGKVCIVYAMMARKGICIHIPILRSSEQISLTLKPKLTPPCQTILIVGFLPCPSPQKT
jgi:hypothetical protein